MTAARLLVAAALFAGCSSSAAGPAAYDEPALLRFAERDADVVIADTVAAGAPIALTVTTFGGGCTREASGAEVRQPSGGVVVVRLFNRNSGASACTDDLLRIEHHVALPPTGAGTLTVRVEGGNRGPDTNWTTIPWTVARAVMVR